MANAGLSYLVEYRCVEQFAGETWLGDLAVGYATGNFLPSSPLLLFHFQSSREQPAQSGNHMMEVRAELHSSMNPNVTKDYNALVVDHNTFAANIHDRLTAITPAGLSGAAPSGFDNCLEAYHFKIMDMSRDIDTKGEFLEDAWDLEIYGAAMECS